MAESVKVRGLDQLIKKLRKVGQKVSFVMEDLAHKGALYVHSQVPAYPPARPQSGYGRSGTLGRTLTTKTRKRSNTIYEGIIGSPIEYAPWVISEEKGLNESGPQAWFHENIWWTLQEVVREATDKVVELYEREISRIMRTLK